MDLCSLWYVLFSDVMVAPFGESGKILTQDMKPDCKMKPVYKPALMSFMCALRVVDSYLAQDKTSVVRTQ